MALKPARDDAGRIAAGLARQVELALSTIELSISQYRVLGLLDDGSAFSSWLADRLAVRPPSVTAVVDGLVGRGLVARSHAQDDRRRVSHELTSAGRRVLAEADAAVNGRLRAIADALPAEGDRAQALGGLKLWEEAMVAHRSASGAATATTAGPSAAVAPGGAVGIRR